jgi:hypothetical protein
MCWMYRLIRGQVRSHGFAILQEKLLIVPTLRLNAALDNSSRTNSVGADSSAKTDCQALKMCWMYRPIRGQVRSHRLAIPQKKLLIVPTLRVVMQPSTLRAFARLLPTLRSRGQHFMDQQPKSL